MRITNRLHVRDWLFSTVLGPLRANIKILEIGDLLLVGMPCDYSGELSINNKLDKIATDRGKHLFITSFNGNYVGYITEDGHYASCNHDEVKSMNWVGPYKGTYFTEIIKRTIWKATD
jgi:neutral ceramidase